MSFLEYLRNQAWYKPVVTSWIFLLTLRVFPRRVSFRLLKRLGPVEVKIRVGPHAFWIVTSSEDDHYLEALIGGLRGWETESLKTWAALCSRGGTVVDVGAYGGVYTALAIASGAEHVISYEPNPEMFTRLRSTIERNSFGAQVTARQVALSDQSGNSVLMVLEGRQSTSGAHLETVTSDPAYSWVRGHRVKTLRFDEDADSLGIDTISAMKLDVEGLECEVIRGASYMLTKNLPPLIVECLSRSSLNELVCLASKIGYADGQFIDQSLPDSDKNNDNFSAGNFLFR